MGREDDLSAVGMGLPASANGQTELCDRAKQCRLVGAVGITKAADRNFGARARSDDPKFIKLDRISVLARLLKNSGDSSMDQGLRAGAPSEVIEQGERFVERLSCENLVGRHPSELVNPQDRVFDEIVWTGGARSYANDNRPRGQPIFRDNLPLFVRIEVGDSID